MESLTTNSQSNIYEKLLIARTEFAKRNVKKSGINRKLEFQYYQLEDIIPVANDIFNSLKIIPIFTITDGNMVELKLIDLENSQMSIKITLPFATQDSIMSRSGAAVTTAVQNVGSSITYYRRYCYMVLLDICEADSIDSESAITVPKAHKPVSTENREVIKAEVTAPNGSVPPPMLTTLKRKLKEFAITNKEMVQEILKSTNQLQNLTKSECENLIADITNRLEEMEVNE